MCQFLIVILVNRQARFHWQNLTSKLVRVMLSVSLRWCAGVSDQRHLSLLSIAAKLLNTSLRVQLNRGLQLRHQVCVEYEGKFVAT